MTWLSLLAPLYSRVSGCQVRLRHASSVLEEVESLLDQVDVGVVGDVSKLLLFCCGENGPALGEPRAGPKTGGRTPWPWGDWNGLLLDGTLKRRLGVLDPAYMLCERECELAGDMTDPHRGLFWPVENVAEVGVLKSPGEGAL